MQVDTHDSELAMNDYGNWHEIYDNDYGLEELEKFAKLICYAGLLFCTYLTPYPSVI